MGLETLPDLQNSALSGNSQSHSDPNGSLTSEGSIENLRDKPSTSDMSTVSVNDSEEPNRVRAVSGKVNGTRRRQSAAFGVRNKEVDP